MDNAHITKFTIAITTRITTKKKHTQSNENFSTTYVQNDINNTNINNITSCVKRTYDLTSHLKDGVKVVKCVAYVHLRKNMFFNARENPV